MSSPTTPGGVEAAVQFGEWSPAPASPAPRSSGTTSFLYGTAAALVFNHPFFLLTEGSAGGHPAPRSFATYAVGFSCRSDRSAQPCSVTTVTCSAGGPP
ncbi:hypothetical protein HBB16_10655 [Pseudonocardia sp. MCCB 268]|nr:hypothetical protein [Pseudonocardia cytotoxica]